VSKKQWSNLSPGIRRLILIGGAFEAALKVVALVDLVRRPSDELRGSKPMWAAAIVVINSGGVVPIAYFAYGRHRT
jgi:Phospholipase_D-nuclease N-terminal